MFKTFVIGIFLGVVAGGAALYFLSPVDQVREHSIISVLPNGGNSEEFHANVPTDRIMVGAPGQQTPLPAGLDWPSDELLADSRTELFKIRNSRDAVVGVASRIAASNENGDLIEWVLHLPARGSAYVLMRPNLTESGDRVGELRAGTHEFADLAGQIREKWVADTSDAEDAPAGRIELQARFVSTAIVEEPL
ncbi:MAG: hypothetical protein ACR2QT_05265 [Woeseiaceae bacterium]